MHRRASGFKRRLAPALICAVLALSGCGGGAVSVRSNFTGPPIGAGPPAAPAPPPSGGSVPQGFYAAGEGNIILAVIVGMMIIDGLSWATERFRQTFTDSDEQAQAPATIPAERKTNRRPAYSWVFNGQ